ncbi:MAG TPA: pyruvate, phosphate dikinase [Thermodesulfobacteriota bacterium]|nr:pyruvate, phosphate dikinase [Thermodesulfobacteriota bacterium]
MAKIRPKNLKKPVSKKDKGKKYVYFFGGGKADGHGKMKDLLGGKGAGLAEMTRIGISVPPGFTVSTEVCRIYYENKKQIPDYIIKSIDENLVRLEKIRGKKFGDSVDPLLVSVRSGSKFSMPGMMDTVLNLGLNDKSVIGLSEKTGNLRFVWDAYRRFIQMFGDIVLKVDKEEFEKILERIKHKYKAKQDVELGVEALKDVVAEYKQLVKQKTKIDFPQDPRTQLDMAINAVFLSWNNPRAIFYRKQYGIPHDIGTAVNIQTMVFGNKSETSGTGVGFTRDPATGEKTLYAEYLMNAQGEDVVAGIRTPKHIEELEPETPHVYKELIRTAKTLEKHFRDMQDFEFTIEGGKLYLLQTRSGKRTGIASGKLAYDMVKEKLITKEEALLRVEPQHLEQFLFPIFNPNEKKNFKQIAKGLAASPGAAAGRVALDAETAVEMKQKGDRVILVRKETSPDDIHGMAASLGVLTARGGRTSHAAVVGRQMGKVCVVGAEEIVVDEEKKSFHVGDVVVRQGDYISIDGFEGKVYLGDIPVFPSEVIQVIEGSLKPEQSKKYIIFSTILSWADKVRRLGIRTNADIPRDAKVAVKFGAEGIGLCRTEHMFFAEDRIPLMQGMILAKTRIEREEFLDKLLPMQKEDFKGLFREMNGYPVTIRLLDPPLHEFLPKREELMVEIKELELLGRDPALIEEKRKLLARVEELHEFNPMLGLRGCRLGILMPEISRMQVQAIMEAACEVADEGVKVIPEIMVPLVGMLTEIKAQKDIIDEVAKEVMKGYGKKIKYYVGTMIEVPRATVTADEIAGEAEFFSFGTNDLTQTTFAFSRDDAGKFIRAYMESKVSLNGKQVEILEKDPFSTLDIKGVGEFMKIAIEKGRKTRPNLKVGICGEHGGDPDSIEFCHNVGMNYVSCSPYRVPIARLSAARIALKEKLNIV